jgi:hypothetical protein
MSPGLIASLALSSRFRQIPRRCCHRATSQTTKAAGQVSHRLQPTSTNRLCATTRRWRHDPSQLRQTFPFVWPGAGGCRSRRPVSRWRRWLPAPAKPESAAAEATTNAPASGTILSVFQDGPGFSPSTRLCSGQKHKSHTSLSPTVIRPPPFLAPASAESFFGRKGRRWSASLTQPRQPGTRLPALGPAGAQVSLSLGGLPPDPRRWKRHPRLFLAPSFRGELFRPEG